MRKYGVWLICFIVFFFGVPFSFAYFAQFLIGPESIDVPVHSLETSNQNITISIDPSYDYGGEVQYIIERNVPIDGSPDLCPYLSLGASEGEATEYGFSLYASNPSRVATGQLYAPEDETDTWALSITSPCFEGECPANYNPRINGAPLPQTLKNQTFKCNLSVESNFIVPVKGIGINKAYAAITNTMTVSAVFTGETEQRIDPVIIIPGIVGTELYNGSDLIWLNLDRMFVDINDYFLTDNLNLDNSGKSLVGIKIGNIIKNQKFSVHETDIFKSLIQDIETYGYQENKNLFFFPYDWRLDLNATKDLLKQKIDEVKTKTGKSKVNIIAHSMGGLLVKDYLNQYGKESVDKLIFVGTPHLGAPKAGKILLEGDRFGIPWLEEDRIKEIAQNSPALYELLPNQKYFNEFQGYFRKYSIFSTNPLLNYEETKNFFLNDKSKNPLMFQKAEDFYNQNLDNFDFSGLETYNIAGCKTPTQTAYSFGIFNEIGQIGYTSGDGTVPMVSADHINIPNTNKFYVKDGNHAELPSTNGVRDLILEILNDDTKNLENNVSNNSSFCNFKGKKLTWHSPVEIHIYSNGKHTGPIENNAIEYEVPGIDYDVMGHNKFIFLPTDEGQEYQVEAKGLEEGSFDLSISEVDNGQYLTTQVFNDVSITTTAIASFVVNNLENNSIELKDGGVIKEVPISATLNGEQILDLTPPETIAKAEWVKDKKQKKSLQITLTATDNQSGILETAYSLDEGNTFDIYTKPIIVEKKIEEILFYSVDKAGNNEEVKEFDLEKNKPNKCKSWKCLDINKKHDKIEKGYKEIKDDDKQENIKKFNKLRHE